MKLTAEQVEELRERLDRHDENSDCYATGDCCSDLLIEFLRELLSDA